MEPSSTKKYLNISFKIILSIFCCLLVLLAGLIIAGTGKDRPVPEEASDAAIMERFDLLISDALDEAEEAALSVPRVFWLSEDAEVGPVPDQANYGSSNDPSSLQWLLDDAKELLNGQQTLFSTDIVLMPGSELTYYLDESIFAITWKQVMDNTVYTISEIKVSHPSQFRRHILDSKFDGPALSLPTLMSQSVNAVVGSAADHYLGRRAGIIVYEGEVKRINLPQHVDVCYIDDNGDLLFSYAGEIMDKDSAQKYVDKNNISFSIAFGPILIDNGVRREITQYMLGEVHDKYARAALCQMGPLHYLVVTANSEGPYWQHLTIHQFARRIETFGCEKAYTLDGGNTGSIVMNGKLINRTTFGYERFQGDLIYFCTAVPNHIE